MDGDGINDILTGSYNPGNMYLYRGKGGGQYAAGEILKGVDGKDIAINSSSTPAPIDWNGDGKLDLVVGFIGGPAKLLINEGGTRFGAPQDIVAGGKPIEGSRLGMCVADWDGDGTADLVVGDESGTVTFYKGTKTASGRSFAAGIPLVSQAPATGVEENRPYRVKPAVADWNGDGKPDLLVGDFSSYREAPKSLTAAQKKRLGELQKEQRLNSETLNRVVKQIREKVAKKLGYMPDAKTDPAKTKAFNDSVNKAFADSKEFQEAAQKNAKIYQELGPLQGEYKTDGNVLVYLRM